MQPDATRMLRIRNRGSARQRGISLLTTLVMLVMVMLLGLSAWQLSQSQRSLSGNLQFQAAAFGEGEAAIARAETWLSTGTNYKSAGFTSYSSGTGLYPIGYLSANNIDLLTMTWDSSSSLQGGDPNQRYVIELLATGKQLMGAGLNTGGRGSSGCDQVNTYRIVARGVSARGATRFIQSVFSVLSC